MKNFSALPRQRKAETRDIVPVARIQRLLGDVVLIPNHALSKQPIGKSWQRTTLESMRDRLYLRSFAGKNIGVLLGQASGGLCTIDIDQDADVEPFLASNPKLRSTTRTKRVRGCNLWIYVEGDFPPSTRLPFGEWRADGNQTVIYGSAIDRRKGEIEPTEYKFLLEVPPIRVRFSELTFPKDSFNNETPPIRLHTASCITASLHDCIPASLHNNSDRVIGNITAKNEAEKALEAQNPALANLYSGFIEPRFQAQACERNNFIVQAVPFLFRAVAVPFVLELVAHFYDCNRSLFHDTREQHIKECKAMLEAVTTTYLTSLSADERKIYDSLGEHEKGAFRICRDLALLPEPQREPLTFFLSFDHLGARLGIFPMQAQRVMRQLQIYGLVKLLKKGTRRARGVKAEAGTYRWQLPIPQSHVRSRDQRDGRK